MSLTTALRCEDPGRTGCPDDYEPISASATELFYLLEILDDPIIFNEAFSIEGVEAPYARPNGHFQQCANRMAEKHFQEDVLKAIAQQDFDALGRLVAKVTTDYAQRIYDIRHS
tara:strand:- start:56 stop:397 length:342 start_codon:yes stop_codon:yes gene_type:complete